MKANITAIVVLMLLLNACATSGRRYETVRDSSLDEVQQTIDEVVRINAEAAEPVETPPEDILRTLVPGLSLGEETLSPVDERFDFVVQDDMNAREFFTLLTAGTDFSIVVHPSVNGNISSLDLKNVTLVEALEQVADLYGLRINRSGDIFQVLPGGMETRIFNVNYLNVTRNGTSNMQITSAGISQSNQNGLNNNLNNLNNPNNLNNQFNNQLGGQFGNQFGGQFGNQNSGGASINTTTETDYWEDLQEVIESIIETSSAGGNTGGFLSALTGGSTETRSVIVSPQTGMIVVRAYPNELDKVEEFLETSQSILQRQVVLEAKILEVDLREEFQSGIDLSLLSEVNDGNEFGAVFNFTGESLDGVSSPVAFSYTATDFDSVIQLLETQGTVQVVSSPRIATLNNQKAVFKVGDERYFLTSANTTSFGAGDQSTTNQNLNLQPFFSGIALDVTPQISDQGIITLHIHPILSQVQEEVKSINGQSFPLANSTTRESDSIARARNGEVIVISGLMQTRTTGQDAGLPGTRNTPLIGEMLNQRQQEMVKTELVILLRAVVDDDGVMQDLIRESADGFDDIRGAIDPSFGR